MEVLETGEVFEGRWKRGKLHGPFKVKKEGEVRSEYFVMDAEVTEAEWVASKKKKK